MTQDDAFLLEIRENAEDDGTRLVYADWLDDHGDADRAEFIRAQVELARLPAGDARQLPLTARAGSLLLRYENAWRGALPALEGVTWEDFSRGFVDAVFVETDGVFLEHRQAIFAAAPIRRLQIGRIAPDVPLRLLAFCRQISRLTELNLGNNPGLGPAVTALAQSPHLGGLTSLLMHYCDLGDRAVEELASSPKLGRLRELYLSGNELGDGAALALARCSTLPALADLDLRDNRIGDAGARALAYFGQRRLETLWLVNNQIGAEGAWALAGTEALPALSRLYLNYNPVGDDGAVAFACSPHRRGLRELDLRHCGIRERGALALAESAYLEGLEQLWLGGNRLRFETLARLRRRFGERLRI